MYNDQTAYAGYKVKRILIDREGEEDARAEQGKLCKCKKQKKEEK